MWEKSANIALQFRMRRTWLFISWILAVLKCVACRKIHEKQGFGEIRKQLFFPEWASIHQWPAGSWQCFSLAIPPTHIRRRAGAWYTLCHEFLELNHLVWDPRNIIWILPTIPSAVHSNVSSFLAFRHTVKAGRGWSCIARILENTELLLFSSSY